MQTHPLRRYRQERGIKINDLARETHVHKATISRIERGKQTPSVALVRRLISASGGTLSSEDFMGHSSVEGQGEALTGD